MTPYWWVMGSYIRARMASAVETDRVRDSEGGMVPRQGVETRDYGTAYLSEREALEAARGYAKREVARAEQALARARAVLEALA